MLGRLARKLGAQVPGRMVASSKSWLSHTAVDRLAPTLPWGAPPDAPKVAPGPLRPRQLIPTYGPGAPVDLPRHSVLVGGLEVWEPQGPMIREPRLVAKIKRLFPKVKVEGHADAVLAALSDP